MTAKETYLETGAKLKNAEESQMFGKPCFKINGKAFISFFEDCMVFKLTGTEHTRALKLKNSKLFDPSARGRPMKEWVQVPFEHHKEWASLAGSSLHYVKG